MRIEIAEPDAEATDQVERERAVLADEIHERIGLVNLDLEWRFRLRRGAARLIFHHAHLTQELPFPYPAKDERRVRPLLDDRNPTRFHAVSYNFV